jgi:hypothetical protein
LRGSWLILLLCFLSSCSGIYSPLSPASGGGGGGGSLGGVNGNALVAQPLKTAYVVGDSIDKANDLKVFLVEDGNSSEVAVGDYTTEPAVFNASGAQTVTVKSDGKTAAYNVSVSGTPPPPGTEYTPGGGIIIEIIP